METSILIGIIVLLLLLIVVPGFLLLRLYLHDGKQNQHSVLINYPILGKMRYILEKIGPELRQYLYLNDREGEPFNRKQFEFVVKAGKYNSSLMSYGAVINFEEDGYFLVNNMFPLMKDELKIGKYPSVTSLVYQLEQENLFNRKEHQSEVEMDPYLLGHDDTVVLGKETARHPFYINGLIGQSAMSYGALGENAISALSMGLGIAGGTWMNTGEGGVSPYHLKGNTDLIMQISPGLYDVRTHNGDFSWEQFKKHANTDQIKAFELKLGQGAKTKGGHVDGGKITKEIAEIRKIDVGQDVNSPNRFPGISSPEQLLAFVDELREVGGKPVGIKIVVGNDRQVERLVKAMAEINIVPDFITVDGSEGGTGASYYGLAYSVGLPAFAAIPLVEDCLKKYQLRNHTKIIASGKLITPDKIAMALCLGADLINIARGFMISVGCIMAQVCHTNTCPVGVATTDEKLQKALTVDEKKYRVANYVITLRNDLFDLAAVAGLDSPTKFSREHLIYRSRLKEYLS
ncbi:FMN-binding glutamate synthase family protein [Radiobacillus sp. PE A8.2]|uniref:FMN-binding glutamate synthase family protein n=1 Tax=Radiobacillus sp. PE A8.2 TaxID=3380349 RepID=UPI00388CED19